MWLRDLSRSASNNGQYSWTITPDVNPRTDYRIRVCSVANPTTYCDLSDGPDGAWLPCANPWTGVLYSGTPHTPADAWAEVLGGNRVQLHWKPDRYGVWNYQLIAWRDGNGWVRTDGPGGSGYWHVVDYGAQAFAPGTADFQAGWADLTLPEAGDYTIFLRGIGWAPPYLAGDFGAAQISVGP